MPARLVAVERHDSVATIALNRPRAKNRVNAALAQELAEACASIGADDAVRVAVLTGRGADFSVGWERPVRGHGPVRAAPAVAALRKPVVAAINGDCVGQGLELALACDLRVAVRRARLGLNQVAQGLLPWDGGTQRLPRLVGWARALRLLLTGETVSADEALRIGLVHQVTADDDLDKSVAELTRRLLDGAPVAAAYAKEAVASGMDMTLAQGLRLEADLNILLHTTEDRHEGIRSFLERRPPRFRGQ